jgi:hypothetical protein
MWRLSSSSGRNPQKCETDYPACFLGGGIGVINVAMLSKIRRWYFRDVTLVTGDITSN